MTIIDQSGRRTLATKHNSNQIWGNLRTWFENNGITPGTRIEIQFDPGELPDGERRIVRIKRVSEVLATPAIPLANSVSADDGSAASPANESEAIATELPLSIERQLEDFLAANISLLEPGLQLYSNSEGQQGRQYPTDVGVIDLLAIRPNGDFLVVELKRGRSSDAVVGQISRYMGWIARHVADSHQVFGLILTYERDESLRYAVYANPALKLKRFRLRLDILPEEEV